MTYRRFPHLLSPLTVGSHTLRNRVVMGSLHTRLDTLDDPMRRQAAFYAERAKGGVALIVTGGYAMNEAALMEPDAPSLTTLAQAREHRRITDAVHAHGAKILLQLLHAGRYAKHEKLVEGGPTGEETGTLARALEAAGIDLLNTGIGWHESRVPTIAYHVPRAAFRFATARLKHAVSIPVVATNRINTPHLAEELLARGEADLIQVARPMLADPHFVRKVEQGREDEINVCIACNQACLDYIFNERAATCLVNPKAGREVEFDERPVATAKRVAVVGAGPAGLACAIAAAARGHSVVLFEAEDDVGGQLQLARRIPGKYEFNELLHYFKRQLEVHRVDFRLNSRVSAATLANERFDHLVMATGIEPRTPNIEGIAHPKVVSYVDVILGQAKAGRRVAVIGTGGIGFDVSELLLGLDVAERLIDEHEPETAEQFFAEWGVDPSAASAGGLRAPAHAHAPRAVTMMQRSRERPGARLGVSTGWILREKLKRRHLKVLTGVTYRRIDDAGLHYTFEGEERLVEVDTIVVCAGQEPSLALARELKVAGIAFELIGGAKCATELDAVRAIDEGTRLAYRF